MNSSQKNGFLILLYETSQAVKQGGTLQVTTTPIICKVLPISSHLSIVSPDISMIKGAWPIQILARLNHLPLTFSEKLGSHFFKKNPPFFRLTKTLAESEMQLEISKVVEQILATSEWNSAYQHYQEIKKNHGCFLFLFFLYCYLLLLFLFCFFLSFHVAQLKCC